MISSNNLLLEMFSPVLEDVSTKGCTPGVDDTLLLLLLLVWLIIGEENEKKLELARDIKR